MTETIRCTSQCVSPIACDSFGYCRNKNTPSFMRLKADYPVALAKAMQDYPDEYMQGLSPSIVAGKMLNRIGVAGIGAVNINSHSFRILAKRYGIKNTYKAWREWGVP